MQPLDLPPGMIVVPGPAGEILVTPTAFESGRYGDRVLRVEPARGDRRHRARS